MNDTNKKQLGKTLWNIADQLRGVMNADDTTEFEKQMHRKVHYVIQPSHPWNSIADCLTSLHDLIAAQTQKLDALKTHKKELMQQLFPSLEEVEA